MLRDLERSSSIRGVSLDEYSPYFESGGPDIVLSTMRVSLVNLLSLVTLLSLCTSVAEERHSETLSGTDWLSEMSFSTNIVWESVKLLSVLFIFWVSL